jgi:threonine dehydrogenase-like Zn-dependent dehydrogenase
MKGGVPMWAYKLNGPGFVSRYERPDDKRELGPGQVRLRFKAAGLCGSDMPKLNGIIVRKGAPSRSPLSTEIRSDPRTFGRTLSAALPVP